MKLSPPKTMVIVGGVAGGASCATRLRRMGEGAEIIVFERGPYASFANCGLPCHVGSVIEQENDLLVAKGQVFHDGFAIDLRTQHEVVTIDREAREEEVLVIPGGLITSTALSLPVLPVLAARRGRFSPTTNEETHA